MPINIPEAVERLCYRYPSPLVDAVTEHDPGRRMVAFKNVSVNEDFFQGHFPGAPIMPGVLVIESMAQAGAVLMLSEMPDRENKLAVFTGIDNAKFRSQVVPGDQLRIEVDVLNFRSRFGKMAGKAYVGDKLACEATLTCMIVPRAAETKSAEAAE